MTTIELSLGDLDKGIKQLQKYIDSVETKINKFVDRLLNAGVDIAKAKIIEIDAIDTGELEASIDCILYKKGNQGIIFTNCPYACYVEFGTGIKGANRPYPDVEKRWQYDVNNHGMMGWYYFNEKTGQVEFTRGMPSRHFMYDTAKELERKCVEIAKDVFSK